MQKEDIYILDFMINNRGLMPHKREALARIKKHILDSEKNKSESNLQERKIIKIAPGGYNNRSLFALCSDGSVLEHTNETEWKDITPINHK